MGLAIFSVQEARQAAVESAKTHTANLATAVERDIAGLLARIDIALLNAGDEVARQASTTLAIKSDLRSFLNRQAERIPEAVALRFADKDGWNQPANDAPRINVAAHEHFLRTRAETEKQLVVGKPILAENTSHWVLPVARRVERPDGTFMGMVYALISLDRLTLQFSRMDVGRHGGISLRDGELGLIARAPQLEGGTRIGDRSVSQTAKDLAAAETHAATITVTTPADGRTRTTSLHRVEGYPLYVAATLAEEEYLVTWLEQTTRISALAATVMLLALLTGIALTRSWRRGMAEIDELAESRQLLQTVTEHAHDWVYWRSADGKVFHYLSAACETISGYSRAEFEADPDLLDRIIHPDDRARWDAHLHNKPSTFSHDNEEYRILTRHGETRWLNHSCREVLSPDGTRLGRCGTHQNVTGLKCAAETLQRQLGSFKALNAVAALRSASLDTSLHEALTIGAQFLGLEFGIVSHVQGELYTVVAQVSPPDTLQDGQTFPLGVTYCSITLAQNGVVAIGDMGRSAQAGHPCYQTFKLETYIGAPVVVSGDVYGTVNFSSPQPYPRAFDEGDREFISLLARWVGAAIEREHARRRLAESEASLRAIIDTEPECVKLLALDGTLLQMNPAGLAMIEADSPEQVIGRSMLDILLPSYRTAFLALNKKVREGGSDTLEFEIMGLKGGRRWLETHATPLRDTDGTITALLGVTRDITRRKLAEDKLEEGTRRMRALIDASDESMLLLTPEGILLAINQAGAHRLNQVPEQMIGTNFLDRLPADLAATRRADLAMVTRTGHILHTRDQRGTFSFDNSLYPVKNDAGQVESVAVYAKDITEHLRDEQTENLFRQADAMLLQDRKGAPRLARMFCEGLLPLLDISVAWVGLAQQNGELRLLASAAADAAGAQFNTHIRQNCCHWRGSNGVCDQVAAVIANGQTHIFELSGGTCSSCANCGQDANIGAALLMPLILRDNTVGILALYASNTAVFARPEISARLDSIASRFCMTLEAALQQEWLALLETALATASNAAFITDDGGHILWVNQAFMTLSGFTEAELVGARPKLLQSGAHDDDFYHYFWDTLREGHTWHGEFINARRDGSRYTVNQTITPLRSADGNITHYVSILEDITARKAAEARIEHMANFDLLTDLPNRGLLFDRLGQALALAQRDNYTGALLFLDLDRFKQVNDTLGHEAGDTLLRMVASRCLNVVRESDTVARLAGDEFTILLPHITTPEGATRVAEKIIAAIGHPYILGDCQVEVGVSIGIALFPQHGDHVEAIVNAADSAMYDAKHAGRHTYRIYGQQAGITL